MRSRRGETQHNIAVLAAVMLAVLGVIVLRYGWLQLVQGGALAERMESQVGHDFSIQSPRGTILDRNGRELAVSTMTKSLYIDPAHVKDPEAVAADLAPLIDTPEQEILDDIAVGGGFVWVKRRMEQSEYEAVRRLIKEKSYADCMNFRDEAKGIIRTICWRRMCWALSGRMTRDWTAWSRRWTVCSRARSGSRICRQTGKIVQFWIRFFQPETVSGRLLQDGGADAGQCGSVHCGAGA